MAERKMESRTPAKFDVMVVGSNMIDLLSHISQLPKMGETVIGDSFHLGHGGKGANQAVMAARLGARVGMITKVGDDVFGKMTIENFAKEGISTDTVFIQKNQSSGVAPIFVDRDGSNMIVIIPGANLDLTPQEVQGAAERIQSSKTIVSQLEINEETIIAGFQIAKESGITTILNPAPARPISDELIKLTDLIIPNETEAEVLTGIKVEGQKGAQQAAGRLLAAGAKQVILTLGADGAYLFDSEHQAHFPALRVEPVDTTGAGDAFIGSLAYALAQDQSLPEAIRFANLVAAISVTKIGTQTSFPTAKEVDQAQSSLQ